MLCVCQWHKYKYDIIYWQTWQGNNSSGLARVKGVKIVIFNQFFRFLMPSTNDNFKMSICNFSFIFFCLNAQVNYKLERKFNISISTANRAVDETYADTACKSGKFVEQDCPDLQLLMPNLF